MKSAGFKPHYILRTMSSNNSSLEICVQAHISNSTGEDWNDVALVLSTASVSERAVIPKLNIWTLDSRDPAQMRKNPTNQGLNLSGLECCFEEDAESVSANADV